MVPDQMRFMAVTIFGDTSWCWGAKEVPRVVVPILGAGDGWC